MRRPAGIRPGRPPPTASRHPATRRRTPPHAAWPGGARIAFTSNRGGNYDVYVIGVDGGTPRQLTFYNDVGDVPPRGGVDNQVMDWSPDGKYVVFNAHTGPAAVTTPSAP